MRRVPSGGAIFEGLNHVFFDDTIREIRTKYQ
jgi:hypothetical protein